LAKAGVEKKQYQEQKTTTKTKTKVEAQPGGSRDSGGDKISCRGRRRYSTYRLGL
jgi:hypothetical protein